MLKNLQSEKYSNIKSKLPSRYVSVGPKSAPHRSMYYAMGMTKKDIEDVINGIKKIIYNFKRITFK